MSPIPRRRIDRPKTKRRTAEREGRRGAKLRVCWFIVEIDFI